MGSFQLVERSIGQSLAARRSACLEVTGQYACQREIGVGKARKWLFLLDFMKKTMTWAPSVAAHVPPVAPGVTAHVP
ncbi:hypothetical protein [Comamonas endophytica]|uniref:Uncharacterized protein n=1 Tax=Comamonas endophytica TaxID=2949090 RepID=A0ABY6GA27_9BURK|nr:MULTISPECIES: hypothetical protein [unclassified Acidovorax]MCD2512139.1 hypothetical protein [Acidovorax sp. D4N7]UYG51912.1 hypothetical protein M9799_01275 [Acidovorax sp. 5MLIR]